MNLWRVPRKFCKFVGCQNNVVHYSDGPEYASDYCVAHDHNNCLKCGKRFTGYAKDCCKACYDLPCINSCCYKGVARDLINQKDFRSWLLIWKRKLPRFPKDLFRLIARLFIEPHRECYGCGPGIWYPENMLRFKFPVNLCKLHYYTSESRETADFCEHRSIVHYTAYDFQALYPSIIPLEPVKSDRPIGFHDRPIKFTEVCKNCRKPVELDRAIVAQNSIFCSRKCQMKR